MTREEARRIGDAPEQATNGDLLQALSMLRHYGPDSADRDHPARRAIHAALMRRYPPALDTGHPPGY